MSSGAARFASAGAVATALAAACVLAWPPPIPHCVTTVVVPRGAHFAEVVDSLHAAGVIRQRLPIRIAARLQGLDNQVKAGAYELECGDDWSNILGALVRGEVVTRAVTFPEGLTLAQLAPRIAQATGRDSLQVADSLLAAPEVPGAAGTISGQGVHALEGYLFPDTYRFAEGVAIGTVVQTMLDRHRAYWTPGRMGRLAEIGLDEHEAVTLASIVQAESRVVAEMPTIASVYHNRLRIGMPLQADPTVLYALGGHRPRLLYAAMDSVADHPYNTYTHPGLPPGPISAPGEAALDAALWPAETDFLYFVAHPDGSHIFSRSLTEHNRARVRVRR